jgi:hypothetical protein
VAFSAGGDGGKEPCDICSTGMISRRAGLISKYPKLLARLFAYTALLVFGLVTRAWWEVFGVANLACDLGALERDGGARVLLSAPAGNTLKRGVI